MKKILQCLGGLNAASVVRAFRFGGRDFGRATFASYVAALPLESVDEFKQREVRNEFESIPVISMDELITQTGPVMKLELVKYEDGILPFKDRVALIALLVKEQPSLVLEIGTYMGYTTKAMAENLKGGTIHTVDLPPDFSPAADTAEGIPKDDFHLIQKRVVGREFKDQTFPAKIVQHFGDTAKMDFTTFGRPTFFFIDGSHTYEYCKQDSEKCLKICREKSIFLWHDCNEWHPGVIKFVNEWRRQGRGICRIEGTNLAYWQTS